MKQGSSGINIDATVLPLALNPFQHGVAIGFKPLESERAAAARSTGSAAPSSASRPACSTTRRAPPRGLDLVVLRLTQEIDGSPLAPGREMPAALGAPDNAQRHTLAALPLGDASTLTHGDQLVVLGFGCPNRAAGIGLARPVLVKFRLLKDLRSGRWIETAAARTAATAAGRCSPRAARSSAG